MAKVASTATLPERLIGNAITARERGLLIVANAKTDISMPFALVVTGKGESGEHAALA